MTITQNEKAARFRALHTDPGTFVIPNPWDAGSARLLAALDFRALATSSGAAAAVLGRRDGQISRDEAMHHVATVTAPPACRCRRISRTASAPSRRPSRSRSDAAPPRARSAARSRTRPAAAKIPCFDFALAVERVAAAAEAARALSFPFTLTARAEGFLYGRTDLDDVIARLQAFERAGADVLFAPGLPIFDAVRAVCRSVSRPVSFMIAIRGRSFSVAELASAGVKRVSLATSLYRAAMTGLLAAAREIHDQGTCRYLEDTLPTGDMNRLMAEGAG